MEKALLKRNFLLISVIITIILFAAWGISVIPEYNGALYFTYAIIYLTLFVSLLVSYCKGETNCQKVLIGLILMFIIRDELDVFSYYFSKRNVIHPLIVTLMGASFLLFTAFLVNYILMLSDHVGYRRLSIVNNCILILLFIIHIGQVANFIFSKLSLDGFLLKAAELACIVTIACINMRVQNYKRIRANARENGTWNEETRKKAKELFKI